MPSILPVVTRGMPSILPVATRGMPFVLPVATWHALRTPRGRTHATPASPHPLMPRVTPRSSFGRAPTRPPTKNGLVPVSAAPSPPKATRSPSPCARLYRARSPPRSRPYSRRGRCLRRSRRAWRYCITPLLRMSNHLPRLPRLPHLHLSQSPTTSLDAVLTKPPLATFHALPTPSPRGATCHVSVTSSGQCRARRWESSCGVDLHVPAWPWRGWGMGGQSSRCGKYSTCMPPPAMCPPPSDHPVLPCALPF